MWDAAGRRGLREGVPTQVGGSWLSRRNLCVCGGRWGGGVEPCMNSISPQFPHLHNGDPVTILRTGLKKFHKFMRPARSRHAGRFAWVLLCFLFHSGPGAGRQAPVGKKQKCIWCLQAGEGPLPLKLSISRFCPVQQQRKPCHQAPDAFLTVPVFSLASKPVPQASPPQLLPWGSLMTPH